MKKLIYIHTFLFFCPLFFSQQNKTYVEDDEVFINIDNKWVKDLEKYDDSKVIISYDNQLSLQTYQNRFALLDANTRLNIDYNDITFKYVKKASAGFM